MCAEIMAILLRLDKQTVMQGQTSEPIRSPEMVGLLYKGGGTGDKNITQEKNYEIEWKREDAM
jgi:hypothetical protein